MRIVVWGYGKTGRAIFKELKENKKNSLILIKKNSLFKQKKLLKGDLIILCFGSLSRFLGKNFISTYETRLQETRNNKKVFEKFLPILKKVKVPIIIVTNHSDMWERYLKEKLNKKDIFAFGKSLDSERFSILTGRDIEAVGPHGLTVPILNSNDNREYLSLIQTVEKKLLKLFKTKKLNYDQIGKNFARNYLNLIRKKKPQKLNRIEKDLIRKANLKLEEDYKKIFQNDKEY